MIVYIEEYRIGGYRCGIEDMEDGRPDSEHFFPDRYKAGRSKRYQCWVGGSGIGSFHNLNQARAQLAQYVRQRAARSTTLALVELETATGILATVSNDGDGLEAYRT